MTKLKASHRCPSLSKLFILLPEILGQRRSCATIQRRRQWYRLRMVDFNFLNENLVAFKVMSLIAKVSSLHKSNVDVDRDQMLRRNGSIDVNLKKAFPPSYHWFEKRWADEVWGRLKRSNFFFSIIKIEPFEQVRRMKENWIIRLHYGGLSSSSTYKQKPNGLADVHEKFTRVLFMLW